MQEPQPLNRLDVLRGLRISTWEAVWATVWAVLTTGAFQTGFALSIGATPVALGLLAGLPAAVNLLQLPASLYVEKRGERRTFVGFFAVTGRLLWVPILLIPWVVPPGIQLPAFLLLLTLSAACLSVTVPAWTSWMSDLVPQSSRGQYFGQRNMLAGIVTMLVPLPAGAFLDQAVKYHRFDARIGFAVLFAVAAVAAVASFTLILRQPEPPLASAGQKTERANPFKSLLVPLSDRAFRPFLLFSSAVVCGQGLAGQFFTAWQVDKSALSLPYFTVQILGAVASGAGLLSTPLWGYLADKYGSRPVLMLGAIGTIFAPLIWMLTVPGDLWRNVACIVSLNLLSGASWAGVGLTQFNLLLSTSSPANRATYVAMFSASTGVIGFVSPIVGGALMSLLEPVHLGLPLFDLNNYKLLFLLTAILRVGCVFLLVRVKVPDSQPTRYVIGQLLSARPLSGYFKARQLSRPAAPEERQHTVEELAHLRSPLAVEELVAALDDVSLPVREEAAQALGTIGDARAISALGAKLQDLAAGVGELAAHALGEIGHRDATPYLVAAAQGQDATVRLASLRALARLHDPAAFPAFLASLTPSHPTACEAACVALAATLARASGEDEGLERQMLHEAVPRLLYLLSQEVERGMRFASARALGAVAPLIQGDTDQRAVFTALAARLQTEEDAATLTQEAGALARLARVMHCDVGEVLGLLLPLLDRVGGEGLAYKQLLETVSDFGLPRGMLYPYLGLNEMARDAVVSRLLGEVRRSATNEAAPESTAQALDAYLAGDFARFVDALVSLTPRDTSPAALTLDRLHTRASSGYGTVEEALLALLLARFGNEGAGG